MNLEIIQDIKNSLQDLINKYKKFLLNSTIVDVGSNIGLFPKTLIENKINYEQIHLFEPCLDYFSKSKHDLADDKNLLFNNFALGSKIGKKIIYKCNTGNIGWNTLLTVDPNQEKDFYRSLDQEEIMVKKLDDYKLDRLDFVKIDVEGYEAEVIEGGFETIKKFKPYILAEVAWGTRHPFWDKNKLIYKKLFEIGYKEIDLNFSSTADIFFEPIERNK